MSESILRDTSSRFAKEIVLLCRKLRENNIEADLRNQLLRCGTSVGANIYEAQYAQSDKDFIAKLEITLKECNECEFWVELLNNTNSLSESDYISVRKEIVDIRRMIVASVKTMKSKVKES